jgi:hypothetical protein
MVTQLDERTNRLRVSLTKDEVNALYRNEGVILFHVGTATVELTTSETRDTFRKEVK